MSDEQQEPKITKKFPKMECRIWIKRPEPSSDVTSQSEKKATRDLVPAIEISLDLQSENLTDEV